MDFYLVDNRSKRRREKSRLLQDFSSFAVQYRVQSGQHKISPQLALSAFQFLSSTVDPFQADWISESVLRRLVQQGPAVQFVRVKSRDKSDSPDGSDATLIYQQVITESRRVSCLSSSHILYDRILSSDVLLLGRCLQGKPADYFVLILEGRVEVTVGKEKLVFESGPFSHFGSHALNGLTTSLDLGQSFTAVSFSSSSSSSSSQLSCSSIMVLIGFYDPTGGSRPSIKPSRGGSNSARAFSISEGGVVSGGRHLAPQLISDYTVRAVTDVTYLRVSRFLYQAARSATLFERAQSNVSKESNHLDQESRSADSQSQVAGLATDVDKQQLDQGQQVNVNPIDRSASFIEANRTRKRSIESSCRV